MIGNSITIKVFRLTCFAVSLLLLAAIPILLQPPETTLAISISSVILNTKAPIAISGDNIYIAWWTNNTANNNDEVMFRASNDGGATFADKVNLSNTTDADSQDVEIAADGGNNLIVTWWERNATSNEPVVRISTDNGETFGSLLKLASNGTIGSNGDTG